MTRTMRAGPVLSPLNSRGSVHLGGPGLLVLGLGALALLAGLATPAPATNDLLALATVDTPRDLPFLAHWVSGVALVGVGLLAIGAYRGFLRFFLRVSPLH